MANISNEYFTIQGKDEYRPYLESILEMVSEKADIVRSFFRVPTYRPVKVTLFDDLEDLKDEATKTKKKYEEYAEGSFSNKGIGVLVKRKLNDKNLMAIVNKIVHQYSHVIYASIYTDKYPRPLWLDEGIAQTLSGERITLQNSFEKSKSAFLSRIVSNRKEIPKIYDLKKEGNGPHTIGSPRYSGYLLSYFMFNYLLSSQVVKSNATEDDYALLDNSFNSYESLNVIAMNKKDKKPLKKRYNIDLVINDPEYIRKLEQFIVVRTINYFGSYLKVRMSAASFKAIKTPEDIMDYMNANFAYGWFDEKDELHKNSYDFERLYRVSPFDEILRKSYGTPIEYAKFIQGVLSLLGYQATIFINRGTDSDMNVRLNPFVVYLDKDNSFCVMNVPFSSNAGIYRFDSVKKLLDTYISCMRPGETLYEVMDITDKLTYAELLDYLEVSKNCEKVYEKTKEEINKLS